MVMFEEIYYSIEESDTTLLVCLNASTTKSPFHVELHPINGTASGKYTFINYMLFRMFFNYQLMKTLMHMLFQLGLSLKVAIFSVLTYPYMMIMLWKMLNISLFGC